MGKIEICSPSRKNSALVNPAGPRGVHRFIKICDEAVSREALVRNVGPEIEKVGIISGSYQFIGHPSISQTPGRKVCHFFNVDDSWSEYYQDSYGKRRDPVEELAFNLARAFWTHDFVDFEELQSEEARAYVEKRLALLGHGVIVPVFGSYSSRGKFFLKTDAGRSDMRPFDLFVMEQMCVYFHRRYCELGPSRPRPAVLTARESEILQYLPQGKSNREIALDLNISPNTVSEHIGRILLKLNASNRLTASMKAVAQGLII